VDSNSNPSGRAPAVSRPSGVGLALAIVGIIVLCAVLVAAVTAYQRAQKRQRAEASETIGRLQNDYREIADAVDGPDGLPQKIEKRIDVAPTAKGELGQMDRFLRQLMAQMVAQRNEYFSELDTIGWNQVLDGTRIKRDANLQQSRQIMSRARGLVDKYEARSKGLLDGVPAAIRLLDVSESTKRDMTQGFERTAAASRSQLVELWSLERQALAVIEGVLLMLDSSRARWAMEGGNFVFAEQRTLDVFNQKMASIQAITQKQSEMQKRSANSALSKMETLKQ
jgi:hypothetical protein